MTRNRRSVLKAGAVMIPAAALIPAAARAAEDEEPFPAKPSTPTPGKPGDFDFLAGEWRIAHRRKRGGQTDWDLFDGEATCWTILGGVGSVEELRIPARDFSGMGLRLLDLETKVWSDFWVNAKSGALGGAGLTGSFEQGAGLFLSEDKDDQGPYIAAGVWDRIAPGRCRWRQAVSRDAGRSWAFNWIMHWTRV